MQQQHHPANRRNRTAVALGTAASTFSTAALLVAAAPTATHAQDSRSGSGTRQAIYLGAAVGLGLLAIADADRGNEIGALAFAAGTAAALWALNQERQLNRGDEIRAAMEEYNRRHGRGEASRLSLRAPEPPSLLGFTQTAMGETPLALPFSRPSVALLSLRPAASPVTGTGLQTFRMTYGAGIE